MDYNTEELDNLIDNLIKYRHAVSDAKTHAEQDAIEEDYDMTLMDFSICR